MELFPTSISYNSRMIEEFEGQQLISSSGHVFSNEQWAAPLRTFDVLWAVKELAAQGNGNSMEELKAFFLAVRSSTFLFEDPSDHKSCTDDQDPAYNDQTLTGQTGDGTSKVFQLKKFYTYGSSSFNRNVTRMKAGVKFGWPTLGEGTEGVDFTVNHDTAEVTATVTNGETPTWGGEYYVPCVFRITGKRFRFDLRYSNHKAGQTSLMVVEDKRG